MERSWCLQDYALLLKFGYWLHSPALFTVAGDVFWSLEDPPKTTIVPLLYTYTTGQFTLIIIQLNFNMYGHFSLICQQSTECKFSKLCILLEPGVSWWLVAQPIWTHFVCHFYQQQAWVMLMQAHDTYKRVSSYNLWNSLYIYYYELIYVINLSSIYQ